MKYPKFVKDNEFYKIHQGLSDLELNQMFSSNLKLLHKLTTSHYEDLKYLIHDYLEVGIKVFGMDIGIVSDVEGDEYIVCDAITPDKSLKPGDSFELEGTYCREVVQSGRVIGFPHVGNIAEMKDHPVYINMKLESYISAPIYKNNKIFGTLNFSSTKIREHGFSEFEREFISMMANSIGTFLKLKDKEERLELSNQRIRKLTGFVAHDLRTPLGNILSICEFLEDADESERKELIEMIKNSSEKGLEIVHTILEAAVIDSGKLNVEKEKLSLKDIINTTLDEYTKHFSQNSLTVNKNLIDGFVEVDKERMMQVFGNLFSNAAKYSKPQTCVEIKLKAKQNKIEFSITNTVYTDKTQEGLDVTELGSVGLGMEIIQELLKVHGSKLKVELLGNKYSSSFELTIA